MNINVALELTDAGSELAALILSVVAAAVAASFVSLIFTNQVCKHKLLMFSLPLLRVSGERREWRAS